jgi:hypothetical protein
LVVACAALIPAGRASAVVTVANSWPNTATAVAQNPTGDGYWIARANGLVGAAYLVRNFGDASGQRLAQPITDMASTPTGKGYWLVAGDGGIFTYGDAHFYGSEGARHLNKPVFAMAPTKTGRGYWLVASDGGVFTFGDARFYGSLGGTRLDQPIVGLTTTPSGQGYRMVARDGGIFDFGDARFYGSVGGRGLRDIIGMARTPSGKGYWLLRKLGSDCVSYFVPGWTPGPNYPCPTVYSFGDAQVVNNNPFTGSLSGPDDFINNPVIGIASNSVTKRVVVARSNGRIVIFGPYVPGRL